MKNFFYSKITFLVCIFFCTATQAVYGSIDTSRYNELEQCLTNDWGIDNHTGKYLIKKFRWLVENTGQYSTIDDFIAKSKNLKIDFATPREVQVLPAEDGVLCAPHHHLVIFENLYVRILWGSTLPGEREPFHLHAWKSLMVVFKPTIYEMEYPDGKIDTWNGEIGVYELPPNERYACTNIGKAADEMIRFEIKE